LVHCDPTGHASPRESRFAYRDGTATRLANS